MTKSKRRSSWLIVAAGVKRRYLCSELGCVTPVETSPSSKDVYNISENLCVVVGGNYCQYQPTTGVYAEFPKQRWQPTTDSRLLELEGRNYCYDQQWLRDYSHAALVLPLSEWLAPISQPQCCIVEGTWLYCGGSGKFGQWSSSMQASRALAPLVTSLPDESRMYVGWVPDHWMGCAWQPLDTLGLIAAWHQKIA